jgi:hypothetical protein
MLEMGGQNDDDRRWSCQFPWITLLSFLFPLKKRNKRKLGAIHSSIRSTFEFATISAIQWLPHGTGNSIRFALSE